MEGVLNCSGLLIPDITTESPIRNAYSQFEELPGFDAFFGLEPYLAWSTLISGVFGIVGNIVILLVFYKLGFSETIHISYVALTVSDLCCVLFILWCSLCYFPILDHVVHEDGFGEKSSFRECDRRLAAICLLENHSSDNSLDQPRAMSLRVFPYQGQSYGHQNRHKDCFSDNLHCRPVPRGVCLHWIQN